MAKEFRAPKSQDFEIFEDGKVIGQLRIKPNNLLWSPKGAHSWYGVTLEQFAEFVVTKGKKQEK